MKEERKTKQQQTYVSSDLDHYNYRGVDITDPEVRKLEQVIVATTIINPGVIAQMHQNLDNLVKLVQLVTRDKKEGTDIRFELSSEDNFGTFAAYVYWERLETDEELAARVKKAEAAKKTSKTKKEKEIASLLAKAKKLGLKIND